MTNDGRGIELYERMIELDRTYKINTKLIYYCVSRLQNHRTKSIQCYPNFRNRPLLSLFVNKMSAKISTFVFLDLETSGLIERKLMPKITEISLIAVSRNALCGATDALPRILQKLVLAINPKRNIPQIVQNITGLSNDHLDKCECFNSDVYDLIIKFLRRQAEPVCFVAYNGNRFDYPILLSELKTVDQTFDESVLSIDMMCIVKEFFSDKRNSEQECNDLLNDGYDEVLATALDHTMKYVMGIDRDNDICSYKTRETSVDDVNDSPGSSTKKMQAINEKTPESQIIRSHNNNDVQGRKTYNAKRQLNFTCPPINWKLSTVFEHICGMKPENAHTAEGDCLTMISCATRIKDFAQRADRRAVPIVSFIQP